MEDAVLFEELTKRTVRQMKGNFIPNKVFDDSDKLLDPTRLVVKIDHWWKWKPDYRVSDYKLEDVLKDVPPPETKKEVFMKNFALHSEQSHAGKVLGKIMHVLAKMEGRGSKQIHCQLGQLDKMELKNVLKLKTDIKGKKISCHLELRKNEKLVLVKARVMAKDSFSINCYDEVDAKVTGGVNIPAGGQMEVHGSHIRKDNTAMTFCENTVIAYRVQELMELNNKDDMLEADSETGSAEFISAESINCLDKVLDVLKEYTVLHQLLNSLPKQTKSSLLAELREVLGDRTTFQKFLEEKGEDWCKSVCKHLDKLPTKRPEGSHVVAVSLVRFLEALPDAGLNMLANCCFSELQALNKLVAELKTKRSNILHPETLPPKLQDGGEYDWATQLLCSANENLQDDGTLFIETGIQPGGLLLVLCIAVQGLTFLWS